MYKPIRIEKKRIADLERATYNPRVDLQPGDEDFEAINGSLERFGMVQPIVWNERTNRVVGGHQRLTSEEYRGETEVYVSVVDLDEIDEKRLNIALNKLGSDWDEEKLTAVLEKLGEDAANTGFTEAELEALLGQTEVDEDFLDQELADIPKTFNISLKFTAEEKADVGDYIREEGKEAVVELIMQTVKEAL